MHSGIPVLADGRLVCAHPEGRRLLILIPEAATAEVDTPCIELHGITEVGRDADQQIWVADGYGANLVHRFDKDECCSLLSTGVPLARLTARTESCSTVRRPNSRCMSRTAATNASSSSPPVEHLFAPWDKTSSTAPRRWSC
jgi:hypothetical protein